MSKTPNPNTLVYSHRNDTLFATNRGAAVGEELLFRLRDTGSSSCTPTSSQENDEQSDGSDREEHPPPHHHHHSRRRGAQGASSSAYRSSSLRKRNDRRREHHDDLARYRGGHGDAHEESESGSHSTESMQREHVEVDGTDGSGLQMEDLVSALRKVVSDQQPPQAQPLTSSPVVRPLNAAHPNVQSAAQELGQTLTPSQRGRRRLLPSPDYPHGGGGALSLDLDDGEEEQQEAEAEEELSPHPLAPPRPYEHPSESDAGGFSFLDVVPEEECSAQYSSRVMQTLSCVEGMSLLGPQRDQWTPISHHAAAADDGGRSMDHGSEWRHVKAQMMGSAGQPAHKAGQGSHGKKSSKSSRDLHEEGKLWRLNKQRWIALERARKESLEHAKEEQACSFKPKISSYAERMQRPSSLRPEHRAQEEILQRRIWRAVKQRELLEQELRECTFRPLTLHTIEQLECAADGGRAHGGRHRQSDEDRLVPSPAEEDVFQKLFEDAEDRQHFSASVKASLVAQAERMAHGGVVMPPEKVEEVVQRLFARAVTLSPEHVAAAAIALDPPSYQPQLSEKTVEIIEKQRARGDRHADPTAHLYPSTEERTTRAMRAELTNVLLHAQKAQQAEAEKQRRKVLQNRLRQQRIQSILREKFLLFAKYVSKETGSVFRRSHSSSLSLPVSALARAAASLLPAAELTEMLTALERSQQEEMNETQFIQSLMAYVERDEEGEGAGADDGNNLHHQNHWSSRHPLYQPLPLSSSATAGADALLEGGVRAGEPHTSAARRTVSATTNGNAGVGGEGLRALPRVKREKADPAVIEAARQKREAFLRSVVEEADRKQRGEDNPDYVPFRPRLIPYACRPDVQPVIKKNRSTELRQAFVQKKIAERVKKEYAPLLGPGIQDSVTRALFPDDDVYGYDEEDYNIYADEQDDNGYAVDRNEGGSHSNAMKSGLSHSHRAGRSLPIERRLFGPSTYSSLDPPRASIGEEEVEEDEEAVGVRVKHTLRAGHPSSSQRLFKNTTNHSNSSSMNDSHRHRSGAVGGKGVHTTTTTTTTSQSSSSDVVPSHSREEAEALTDVPYALRRGSPQTCSQQGKTRNPTTLHAPAGKTPKASTTAPLTTNPHPTTTRTKSATADLAGAPPQRSPSEGFLLSSTIPRGVGVAGTSSSQAHPSHYRDAYHSDHPAVSTLEKLLAPSLQETKKTTTATKTAKDSAARANSRNVASQPSKAVHSSSSLLQPQSGMRYAGDLQGSEEEEEALLDFGKDLLIQQLREYQRRRKN